MIRKLKVRRIHLDFRHVTGRAVFIGNGTTRRRPLFHRFASQRVTCKTLVVVISDIFFQRLVRIVTGGTSDVAIVRITLTEKDAIWLKANVVDLHAFQQGELSIAAVTRGAELLRQLVATQPARIEDQCRT